MNRDPNEVASTVFVMAGALAIWLGAMLACPGPGTDSPQPAEPADWWPEACGPEACSHHPKGELPDCCAPATDGDVSMPGEVPGAEAGAPSTPLPARSSHAPVSGNDGGRVAPFTQGDTPATPATP